ncbi:MAG: hypothetical protein FJ387_28335 [Verrucomicrobia bacterium]|nr:hypothetical protein [Verrucomicrobiota bacterium]
MLRGWLRQRVPLILTVAGLIGVWYAVYRTLLHRQQHPPRWEAQILAFEQRDTTNPPPSAAVLFVGGSSIRLWETLKRDLTNYTVFRRGFGGAHLTDLVRYSDRIILPYEPELVLVYAGDNDLAANRRPRQVLADFQALVKRIHGVQPATKIAFISIKPSLARWSLLGRIRRANDLVRDYTEGDARLFYIDLFHPMLNARGEPRAPLFRKDGLHLNDAGYRLWADVVRTFIEAQTESEPELKPEAAAPPSDFTPSPSLR